MKAQGHLFILATLFFLMVAFNNCGQVGPSSNQDNQNTQSEFIFSDSTIHFQVDVFYETGAEPRDQNIGLSSNTAWDITENSYQTLFSTHPNRNVLVPKQISEMTEIADQGKSDWTSSELLTLGNNISDELASGSTATISVIFLNGTFEGSNSTLGVHFTGTQFAFVFKDIVASVGGSQTDQIYVEQATVVHEIGHAVGFVNNGVPLTSSHEDTNNAKHTTNDDCVMFFAVESANTILSSLTDVITGTQLNLFETEVLSDGRAFHP